MGKIDIFTTINTDSKTWKKFMEAQSIKPGKNLGVQVILHFAFIDQNQTNQNKTEA